MNNNSTISITDEKSTSKVFMESKSTRLAFRMPIFGWFPNINLSIVQHRVVLCSKLESASWLDENVQNAEDDICLVRIPNYFAFYFESSQSCRFVENYCMLVFNFWCKKKKRKRGKFLLINEIASEIERRQRVSGQHCGVGIAVQLGIGSSLHRKTPASTRFIWNAHFITDIILKTSLSKAKIQIKKNERIHPASWNFIYYSNYNSTFR